MRKKQVAILLLAFSSLVALAFVERRQPPKSKSLGRTNNHWHLRFEWQSNCKIEGVGGNQSAISCGSKSQAQATTGECSSEPYNDVPAPVPGKIEAEEYDGTGCADGSYVPYEPKPDDPEIVYNYPEVLPIDLNAPDKEEKVA